MILITKHFSIFTQPHRPARPSSAQTKPGSEDVTKLRSSQSSRQVTVGLNATEGHAPRRPRAPETNDEPTGASGFSSTAPVRMPKVSSAEAAPVRAAKPEPAPIGSAATLSNAGTGEIDWSKEPLPQHWERKLPKGTNKVHIPLSFSLEFNHDSDLLSVFLCCSLCTSTTPRRRPSGTTPATPPGRASSGSRRPPPTPPRNNTSPALLPAPATGPTWGPAAPAEPVTLRGSRRVTRRSCEFSRAVYVVLFLLMACSQQK